MERLDAQGPAIVNTDVMPKTVERSMGKIYYQPAREENEGAKYAMSLRDPRTRIVMGLSITKAIEGDFQVDLNSEYDFVRTEGTDFETLTNALVELVRAARKNGDVVKRISAETSYVSIKISDINEMRSLLEARGIDTRNVTNLQIQDTYSKHFPDGPRFEKFSDTFRYARVRLFEQVMKKNLPSWKLRSRGGKWISFDVPDTV